jgi:hypothetical protein
MERHASAGDAAAVAAGVAKMRESVGRLQDLVTRWPVVVQ